MKIAIPLFERRIAPRFDCAQSFLLAVVQNGELFECQEIPAEQWSPLERVKRLSDWGVNTLICGGIDKVSARGLILHSVEIYSLVTGVAEDALNSFLKGELEPGIMVGSGGHRCGRWQFERNDEQWRHDHKRHLRG
jgi:predicted Fe-Mo cluster-binding NifX family protein